MKKTVLLFCCALFLAGKISARTDSLNSEQVIREGQAQLCRLFDRNDAAIEKGRPEEMEFVVMVPGEGPVDYVSNLATSGHAADPDGQGATKDSLNARLRRTYSRYGVEMYVVIISSLDVIISTPLPEDITTSKLFVQKLYDDRTNMAALRAEHRQLTDAIINSSIAGRQRDCLVLSMCTYCGAFYRNNGEGCWKFSKIYTWQSTPSTYADIVGLSSDYTNRLKSSNDFRQGDGSYSLLAGVDIFDESAAYFARKANLMHTYTPDSISDLLSHFTRQADYEGLTFGERQHILSVYAGYPMSGSWYVNGDGEEGDVLRVIHFVEKNDAEELLYTLASPGSLDQAPAYHGLKNGKALIVNLIRGMDDALLWSDNNYTALMRELSSLMAGNQEVVNAHLPQTDQDWMNRRIYWDDSHLFSRAPIGTHSYDVTLNDDGTVTVEKEVVDRWDADYNNMAATPNYTPHWDDSYQPVTLQPFDLVAFTNRSSLSMLQLAGVGANQVFFAPAVFLKYADDKTFNSNVITGIAVTLDLVAVATGPAAILGAVRAGDLAMAAFESLQFIGAAANLTANAINDPELQSVVDKFNLIVGVWGFARLATSAGKYTVDFLTEARTGNLQPVSPSLAEDYLVSFRQAESKLAQLDEGTRTKLQRMEEYLGEVRVVADNEIPFINGWTKESVLALPKGQRPNPNLYLDAGYISNHLSGFNQKGGAFLVVKSWIESGTHTSFPLKKYVMLKPDMLSIVEQYRLSHDISVIEQALGYEAGALSGLDDELYIFFVDQTKFNFEMPSGNETGANNLWEPGGYTSGGKSEAIIIDKTNPSNPITHNKDIENLKSQFSYQKVKNF